MTAVRRTPAGATRLRLILVDDHRMIVRGVTSLLERDFEVVAVAHGGDELLRLLPDHPADCVLLDLGMPGRNGYQLIPQIRRLQPDLRILIVTMHVDRVMADACLSAGASGFIPKDATAEELRFAIREVGGGRRYVSPRVPKSSHRVGLKACYAGLHRLTARQQRIMLLFGEGLSGIGISNVLAIGPSTVTFHKQNIMRDMGFETEADLLRYAVLAGAGSGSPELADPPS